MQFDSMSIVETEQPIRIREIFEILLAINERTLVSHWLESRDIIIKKRGVRRKSKVSTVGIQRFSNLD